MKELLNAQSLIDLLWIHTIYYYIGNWCWGN